MTLKVVVVLKEVRCWCGMPLAIPAQLFQQAQESGRTLYCPLGHAFTFRTSDNERLRSELAEAQEHNTRLATANRNLEGEMAVLVKDKAKKEKRVHNGVCLYCHRHFVNVERHMKSKHLKLIKEKEE